MKRIYLISTLLYLTLHLFAQQNILPLHFNLLIEKHETVKEKTIVKTISHPSGDTLYLIDLRNNQFDIDELNIPITDNTQTEPNSIKKPLVTLNGNLLVNESFLFDDVLNKDLIDSAFYMNSIIMDDIVYAPYINITLKDNYIPKAISLFAIKEKYTNLKDQPAIFQINKRTIITQEYDDFMVDEQNISKITIDTSTKNRKEGINLAVINLHTRNNKNATIEKGKYFDYLQNVGKIIETRNRKTGKSFHLNHVNELTFIDFRKNTVEETKADTILRVPVFFEENNNWIKDEYAIFNNNLLVNSSLLYKNVLCKNLIKDICQCGMIALDSDTTKQFRKYFEVTLVDELYIPKTISLANIRKKYIDAGNTCPVIFLIDGEIIFTNEYDIFFVDGNNLSKITIENLCQNKKKQVTVINLLTKYN